MVTKTWDQYHSDVLKLLGKIRDNGYEPDIISHVCWVEISQE